MAKRTRTVNPHTSFRSPTRNSQRNGQVWNAPLYPEIGGAKMVRDNAKGRDALLEIDHTK